MGVQTAIDKSVQKPKPIRTRGRALPKPLLGKAKLPVVPKAMESGVMDFWGEVSGKNLDDD